MFKFLTKLPWYAQIGLAVVVGIGLGVGFYLRLEQPMQAEMETRRAQLTVLRDQITKGLSTAKKLAEFRAQVAELEGRLETLRAVLPEEKDAAGLLRRLHTVAQQSNLTIKNFKPSDKGVNKQLHTEWPISLELDGTYHNLATFFDKVSKFTQIVNITNVDVRGKERPDPSGNTISATCVATTFVLLDKPAAKPAPKPGTPAPPPGAKGA